jgi:hypothetical protein
MKTIDHKGSKWVHTSSTSHVDAAMISSRSSSVGVGTGGKVHQLGSFGKPLPSQKLTCQRGLARAAMRLPESEQVQALAQVLAMMGLLERVFPRGDKLGGQG